MHGAERTTEEVGFLTKRGTKRLTVVIFEGA